MIGKKEEKEIPDGHLNLQWGLFWQGTLGITLLLSQLGHSEGSTLPHDLERHGEYLPLCCRLCHAPLQVDLLTRSLLHTKHTKICGSLLQNFNVLRGNGHKKISCLHAMFNYILLYIFLKLFVNKQKQKIYVISIFNPAMLYGMTPWHPMPNVTCIRMSQMLYHQDSVNICRVLLQHQITIINKIKSKLI